MKLDRERFITLWVNDKVSNRKLEEEFGVTIQTLRKLAREAALPNRLKGRKKVLVEEK